MNSKLIVRKSQRARRLVSAAANKSVVSAADNNGIDKYKSCDNSRSSNHETLFDRVKTMFSETFGEHEISALKKKVNEVSQHFDLSTQSVANARSRARALQTQYEDLQKDHMSLMMRRESWTDTDITKFAEVTSNEVKVKRALDEARVALQKSEEEQEFRQLEYMDAVRMRYHEEQIWQDKWRVISTYGTWILIGLNSMIFIGGQFFHQMREQARVEALEELLNEKLSKFTHIVTENRDANKTEKKSEEQLSMENETEQLQAESNELLARELAQEDEDLVPFVDLPLKERVISMCVKSKATLAANLNDLQLDLHVPSMAFGALMSGLVIASINTKR